MQAWDAFLDTLDEKLGKPVVDKWLRTMTVVQFDACNLYLETKDSFQVAWFEEHVRKIAKSSFLNNNAHPIKIHIETPPKKKKSVSDPLPEPLLIEPDGIDSSQTFANFLYEKENNWTIDFFQSLEPGSYNPIYLYGPGGIGKTHLLMAVIQNLQKKGLNVFYVHAETFTQHVVSAMRTSQMRSFREIYRNQDVLIIDDIEVLARRSSTQEEFFHTFNALHTGGKQIIISSHTPPSRLEEIEPRLVSRFEWGIVLELFPLAKEKIKDVLKAKAKMHNLPISDELIIYLQKNFASSTKTLMRSLDALMMRHKEDSLVSLEKASFLLKDLLNVEKKAQITPEKIIHSVSAYFGIRESDILGKSQVKECAFPRKLAMFLCRQKLGLSYLAIGRSFRRDHSTVMANIRFIEEKKTSQEIETSLHEIEKSIN